MKNILRFIVAVLLVGGWAVAALSLHVVRTPERIVVVPKNRIEIPDTYVDTRSWTLNDAAAHPRVVERLVRLGKTQSLAHVTDLKPGEDVEVQLLDAVKRGPTSQPATKVVKISR